MSRRPLAGAVRAACSVLVAGPLGAALVLAGVQAQDLEAWRALWHEPGIGRALGLSAGTAVLSTVLAWGLALAGVAWAQGRAAPGRAPGGLSACLGPLLAVPHAAFAIGLLWLLAPAGWLARLLALPLGWTAPPDWRAMQDTWGLSLVAVLVLKEVPFLMWNALALLQRPDVAEAVRRQTLLGRSLGVAPQRLWWTVLWPLWAPRLAWPTLAVLAYGLTVVDVALIIGPTSPPTLAVWAWQALSDADPMRNAAGAAAAWVLAALLPALALGLRAGGRGLAAGLRRRAVAGPAAPRAAAAGAGWVAGVGAAGLGVYVAVGLALGIGAFAGPWPFPDLWPSSWQGQAWASSAGALPRLAFTAGLAAGVAALCVGLCVAWLASTPARWDRASAAVLMLPLLVPPLLLLTGLYPLALWARLDGEVAGLVWVHALMALPYALFVLMGPWRSLDPRLITVARLLGHGPWAVAWRVRLPLLRAPLAAAWAVAFAVSVAQYLPTQFIGAGRLGTVTTEAVTLAASGQRGPASAQALWQLALPLAGFAWAAWVARRHRASIPECAARRGGL
jgi:putative thiamine transport system permease protein